MATNEDDMFRDLVESIGFVLIGVDRELDIRFWNRYAEDQFGRPAEEMMGSCFLDVCPGPQREEVEQLFRGAIASKVAGEMELKRERDDGRQMTFVLIASPIISPSGECVGASASMRDISERKRLSRELGRSRRMAALGNMAGGVTHHFNNILGGMLTSIDYVLPSDSPRELRRTLRLLAQAIGRATRITKQLEAFAECEHEKVEEDELNTVLDRFIERIQPEAQRAKIKLVTDISKVSSRPFEAQRLMPVLESLSRNAFDAMSAGETLTVTMRASQGEAIISIADTGCGISADMLDRVFEPFFTTKGELAGGSGANCGLGLAAVHGLVAELGGRIHLSSRVGQGTTVELCLPLEDGRESERGHAGSQGSG